MVTRATDIDGAQIRWLKRGSVKFGQFCGRYLPELSFRPTQLVVVRYAGLKGLKGFWDLLISMRDHALRSTDWRRFTNSIVCRLPKPSTTRARHLSQRISDSSTNKAFFRIYVPSDSSRRISISTFSFLKLANCFPKAVIFWSKHRKSPYSTGFSPTETVRLWRSGLWTIDSGTVPKGHY